MFCSSLSVKSLSERISFVNSVRMSSMKHELSFGESSMFALTPSMMHFFLTRRKRFSLKILFTEGVIIWD